MVTTDVNGNPKIFLHRFYYFNGKSPNVITSPFYRCIRCLQEFQMPLWMEYISVKLDYNTDVGDT